MHAKPEGRLPEVSGHSQQCYAGISTPFRSVNLKALETISQTPINLESDIRRHLMLPASVTSHPEGRMPFRNYKGVFQSY